MRVEAPRVFDTYEETYADRLRFFREIHRAPLGVVVAPYNPAYTPLVWYLGGDVDSPPLTRGAVEAACARRPEMVDALWRADMRDQGTTRHRWEEEFTIATYSGFYRPELLRFMRLIQETPKKGSNGVLLLIPCSADKPYPAPAHRLIIDAVRRFSGFDLAVVSTATGIVPEELWGRMPRYDNGLPLFDRIHETVPGFLRAREYHTVINYTDMLQADVSEAVMRCAKVKLVTPVPLPRRCDYKDMTNPAWLKELTQCFV